MEYLADNGLMGESLIHNREFQRYNRIDFAGELWDQRGGRHIGHMVGPPSGNAISPVTPKPNRW